MDIYVKVNEYDDFVKQSQRSAYYGFTELGYDVYKFHNIEEVPKSKEIMVISGLSETEQWLKNCGINPPLIDYPTELHSFLKRKITRTKIGNLELFLDGKKYFIKPFIEKQFQPSIIEIYDDLFKFKKINYDVDVWLSEFKEIDAEYRYYVCNKEILGCCKYKGHSKLQIDENYIKTIIESYITSPISYTLDVGITQTGEILLIEINDGFSIENYGLDDIKYCILLLERWEELFKGAYNVKK